jgi:hypothetical protein
MVVTYSLKEIKMTKPYIRHSMSAAERLEHYSAPGNNGCIVFTGSRQASGHGEIAYKGRKFRAHRLSYITHVGPIPQGMVICHKCDNPPCINPEHLFLGTQADNLKDARQKGRMKAPNPRGERHGLAKLNAEKVAAIRSDQRTQREIAKEYGVHQTTIKNIKLNRTWKHVGA